MKVVGVQVPSRAQMMIAKVGLLLILLIYLGGVAYFAQVLLRTPAKFRIRNGLDLLVFNLISIFVCLSWPAIIIEATIHATRTKT